ncbi:P-loop containing nucleoside triphosphate hydrolase [Pseudocohnilembus persalinus]|uniref:Kinesin-like protein n=1 Tax=Pseudocohnilembus persalinus TaxID=266149 RepID=A0A0V0QJ66_PSEPJ|nr:P-loop containing nucleoside triphosphate hydrolase [Pseudocohnilembus persalinus]|eukprot:KRX02136.1 P-loop containing nucleoside triphosphate hydrolase [Pseudocohnilembus persalinus]
MYKENQNPNILKTANIFNIRSNNFNKTRPLAVSNTSNLANLNQSQINSLNASKINNNNDKNNTNTSVSTKMEEDDKMDIETEIEHYEQANQFYANNIKNQQELLRQLEESGMELELETQQIYQIIQQFNPKLEQIENQIDQKGCFTNDEKTMVEQKKKLNNQLQELMGNIRVYCRIRGYINEEEKEEENNQEPIFRVSNNESQLNLSVPSDQIKKQTQTQVFQELKQLIQSAIDGYNVCIFAYGQTGSGKTYTMNGDIQDEDKVGITLRAIRHIFDQIEELKQYNWNYKIYVSFTEIYNESVRCLITNEKDKIQENQVETIDQIMKLINISNHNRVVKETSMNEHSSRSHTIFQLKLVGEYQCENQKSNANTNLNSNNQSFSQSQQGSIMEDKKQKINQKQNKFPQNRTYLNNKTNLLQSQLIQQQQNNQNLINNNNSNNNKCTVMGTLNLIDLAGSERLNMSNATGETAKETQAINKSLSALADVIQALARKDSHIPYRNSKLTYHLQNYLGGNSKTLMLVNISPRPQDFHQTLCSLRFAEKVKQCQGGNLKGGVQKQKRGNQLTPSKNSRYNFK